MRRTASTGKHASRPPVSPLGTDANQQTDDPDSYDGAPVGLQIVGQRFQEEYILSIAEILEAALQASGDDKH